MIAAIVAVDNNWGIGKNNKLLFDIPEDKRHFQKVTEHNIVIMGRKTWDSLPKKPLKNRVNVVITKNPPKEKIENTVFGTMELAKSIMSYFGHTTNIFVIGGGQIYKELLQYCDTIFVTRVYSDFKADTFFPDLTNKDEWQIRDFSDVSYYWSLPYQFVIYENINFRER